MEIFHDEQCTTYARGDEQIVYARVNVPWGLNGSWSVGEGNLPGTYFSANAPSTENPDDPYSISVWQDWSSEDSATPYNAGQVVPLTYIDGDAEPVTNPTVEFSKP